jgi:phospholipid/cholesterol/gamma-HCH transport system substrate-binding protein
METRSNHILVGGVVLAMVVALLGFIIWLSQVSGETRKEYDIFFNQAVDGLARGTAVTFNGVPVGQIESINLEPNNPEFVRVRIAVADDTPILQGTTATIQGVGFTGVSQIQLDAGPRGSPPITDPGPYGVPVIPTKPGALGQLLNSAPELLERVSTLTERLTELVSDENQASIAAILNNVEEMSRTLAERGPDIQATLADARIAIRRAGVAADEIGRLSGTTNQLLNEEGRPLISDLRQTIQAAERSVASLEGTLNNADRSFEQVNKQTLPEVNQLVRDLKQTSEALRSLTTRIDEQGATSVLGPRKLPEYEGE